MNFRLTGILFIVAVVLVAGLVIMTLFEAPRTDADGALGESLARLGLKPKDITTVELLRILPGEEKLLFIKSNGKWELSQPFKAKVDNQLLDSVVNDVFTSKAIKYTGNLDNLAIHELDKPTFRVTLADKDNHSLTVNLGRSIPGTGSATLFATLGSSPRTAFALRQSDLSALLKESGKDGSAWQIAKWISDYRQKKLFGGDSSAPMQDMNGLKFSYLGKGFELQKPSATWTFSKPEGFGEADETGDSGPRANNAPFTGVMPLLTQLIGLQVTSNDDIIEKPADLSVYGLKPGDPTVLKIEINYKNGSKEVVSFGKLVEDKGKPVVPTKVYAQIEGDTAVLQVPTEQLVGLQETTLHPEQLRNRDLFAKTRKAQMDALDIVIGTSTLRLRKFPTLGESPLHRWVMIDDAGLVTDAKNSTVDAMLNELVKPRAALDVLSGDQNANFTDAEKKATVKVWLDGMPKLDKPDLDKLPADFKLKGNPTELTFGKKDGPAVFLRKFVDGKATDFKTPETLLTTLSKTRLDLVEPRLKTFTTTQATSLLFYRGAELFELTRDGTAWGFGSPAKFKGQPADASKCLALLGILSSIYSDQVVAELPTPEQLKKYGLDSTAPRMKVVVTVQEDTVKQYTYDFGFDTDDQKFIYARQGGSPFVLLVPKMIFDRFNTDDLRDASFLSLEPATVTKVKLRGWKGQMGMGVTEVIVEKKDNVWTTVSPPSPKGLDVMPTKVEALLLNLKQAKIEGRLEAIKPEQGLDVMANADALEIVIERAKLPPMTIVLGGKADGNKSHATASTYAEGKLPVLIDASGIRQHLAKPNDLAK